VLQVEGASALVALPGFAADGRIERAALTTIAQPPPKPVRQQRMVENRAIAIESGASRVVTACTEPVAVLEERNGRAQVSQTIAGVEISGSAHDAGRVCDPRVIRAARAGEPAPSVPLGWSTPKATPLSAFASSRDIFRLVHDDVTRAPRCATWHFVRRGTHAEFRTSSISRGSFGPDRHNTATYEVEGDPSLEAAPTDMSLMLTSSKTVGIDGRDGTVPPGLGEGWSGDVWTVVILEETAEGLQVLDPEGDSRGIVAYQPSDVQTWYTRREACDNAVSAERAAGAQLQPSTAHLLLAPYRPGG
jgi:hypothetical protein